MPAGDFVGLNRPCARRLPAIRPCVAKGDGCKAKVRGNSRTSRKLFLLPAGTKNFPICSGVAPTFFAAGLSATNARKQIGLPCPLVAMMSVAKKVVLSHFLAPNRRKQILLFLCFVCLLFPVYYLLGHSVYYLALYKTPAPTQ